MNADIANVMPNASLNTVCSSNAARMRDALKRSSNWKY